MTKGEGNGLPLSLTLLRQGFRRRQGYGGQAGGQALTLCRGDGGEERVKE